MSTNFTKVDASALTRIREAALDTAPVAGLTHRFYRYPARFSPQFTRACIESFSKPGQVVLDPFMGGGTTILEAMVLGRKAVGCDLNSLAVFVAKAKTTDLSRPESKAILQWATRTVPQLRYTDDCEDDRIPRNMSLPQVRGIRKMIALSLATATEELRSKNAILFARCVVLNAGQWALNGRKRIPTAGEFRERVTATALTMLEDAAVLRATIKKAGFATQQPVFFNTDTETLAGDTDLQKIGPVDLVVTSPPYPGIHMLYHRWQVDGRKETETPYWIAACKDGAGTSFYNFADRHHSAEDRYFEKAEKCFSAVRQVMRKGAVLVQMVAFSEPQRHLQRYLRMMQRAGFSEYRAKDEKRIWRSVPNRSWHASSKGGLPSSREVVLVHKKA